MAILGITMLWDSNTQYDQLPRELGNEKCMTNPGICAPPGLSQHHYNA